MIKLTLDFPPSINHYYARDRWGNMCIGKRGMEYRKIVRNDFNDSGQVRLTGALEVSVDFGFPDMRRRDIDNPLKSLLDALTHAEVIDDDSYIVRLDVKKHITNDFYSVCIVEIDNSISGHFKNENGAWLCNNNFSPKKKKKRTAKLLPQ